ncbi:MAG: hypothetical protein ACR2LX_08090 [Jatrophihabitans sp.]
MTDFGKVPPPPDAGRGWDPDDLPARESRHPDAVPPASADPVAVTAVVLGFIGIVFFGILMAIVVGILGSYAGQRAREDRRSLELPFLAFGLAAVDGVVWIVMHLLFEVPIFIG